MSEKLVEQNGVDGRNEKKIIKLLRMTKVSTTTVSKIRMRRLSHSRLPPIDCRISLSAPCLAPHTPEGATTTASVRPAPSVACECRILVFSGWKKQGCLTTTRTFSNPVAIPEPQVTTGHRAAISSRHGELQHGISGQGSTTRASEKDSAEAVLCWIRGVGCRHDFRCHDCPPPLRRALRQAASRRVPSAPPS